MTTAAPPVILLRGDEPSLLADALRIHIHRVANGEDLSLGLDDFSSDDYELAAAVEAAQTPPMFTVRRVVVAREVGRFSAEEVDPLLAYLAAPSPTSTLILVAGGGTIGRKVMDAVRKVGEVIETAAPSGKARQGWLSERIAAASVRLDQRAVIRLGEHLGDDVGRLKGILEVLQAVYGEGTRIGVAELEPFLGDAGSGAPWDLTDAIDRGDVASSLQQLQRMMAAGERHPLQIMATLQTHFGRMLRLDGAGVRDDVEAAKVLGMSGSTFPAKKALTQARKLGSQNISRAMLLLADADLDLRGVRDLPGTTVMELLVARLARLGSAARR